MARLGELQPEGDRTGRQLRRGDRKTLRTINKELWLLLSLVVIAAMIHFLVASQAVALVFFFLPTLYSAYHFGRRHATLTACASVCLVVLLAHINPAIFNRRVESLPFDS